MKQSQALYRAFKGYVKQLNESAECSQEGFAAARANAENDLIEVVSTSCVISEDWINEIEKGLKHIEKAINEGRQFIRTDGSVLPIEKAKRVSKDSIIHLAQHSDMISSPPPNGGTLIPDELFISERLSDFAVYENKFLCLLLNNLKSFVLIRYNKIQELTNEYNGLLTLNKTIVLGKRKTVYQLKMNDLRRDDGHLKKRSRTEPLINRIDDILKTITHLLNTPLMQQVLKSPPLKPPVIKTNVLKMNPSFRAAANLYDYISAYDKLGYTVEKNRERLAPLSDTAALEISQTIMLTSFLVYKHGLKLEGQLKNSYKKEEERRRLETERKQKQELALLKRRIAESSLDPMEYMLLLEKRNKTLESDSCKLAAIKQELERIEEQNEALKENIEALNTALSEKQAQMESSSQLFADEVRQLKAAHEKQIDEIYFQHNAETELRASQHEQANQQLKLQHESELEHLQQQVKESGMRLSKLEAKIVAKQIEHAKQLDEAQAEHLLKVQEYSSQYFKKSQECARLEEEKNLLRARLLALRNEYNLIQKGEDFTDKESFTQLEHQFKAFKSFFKDEWKKTKKRIRKDTFSPEPALEDTIATIDCDKLLDVD